MINNNEDYLALNYLANCYFELGNYEKSILYSYNSYKMNDNDNRIKYLIGLNHKNLEAFQFVFFDY